MIVMPAGSSGWFWHSLARETCRIGHLYSPGAQRGPWPWFPYALDNGAFALWDPKSNTFDEDRWLHQQLPQWYQLILWSLSRPHQPRWVVMPDRPGDAEETIRKWHLHAHAFDSTFGLPMAMAVQDGMTPSDVRSLSIQPEVIAIGGSTEFKWGSVENWKNHFPRVHVLRVNQPTKLRYLEDLGIESCDGTGWNRGDKKQTQGVEDWARGWKRHEHPLWPHTCRNL